MVAIKLRIQEVGGHLVSAKAKTYFFVAKVFGPNWVLLSMDEVVGLMEELKLKATEGQLFAAVVKWCR